MLCWLLKVNQNAVYMIRLAIFGKGRSRFFQLFPGRFVLPCCLLRHLCVIFSLVALGLCSSAYAAKRSSPVLVPATPDEIVLEARQWVLNGGRTALDFERMQQRVQRTQNHPLGLYVEYWNLSTRLKNYTGAERLGLYPEFEAFLQRHAGTLPADLLRRDWLLVLGHTADWGRFEAQYPLWVLNDDREVTCHALRSRYAAEGKADGILAAARAQFFAPRELGEGCEALADTLIQAGVFTQADVWQRIRLLHEIGYTRAAKNAAAYLPDYTVPTLELILRSAPLWISRHAATLQGAVDGELVTLALAHSARQTPVVAARQMESALARQLSAPQQAYVWGQIALTGARKLLPEANGWIARANGIGQSVPGWVWSDEFQEWQVRTALRAQDWPLVRQTIERMPDFLRQDSAWVYWLGRAYQMLGAVQPAIQPTIQPTPGQPSFAEKARQQFLQLATQYSFYGRLAQEELGGPLVLPPRAAPVTPQELQLASERPHFQRALAFYKLELAPEGNREWNWGLRGLTDRQLLAAAELARRNEIIDRSISAADRTKQEHDFALRFPSPHQEFLSAQAAQLDLDPNWVYGLIRQESRFVKQARSSVGANGLMQLMPATARWVAKKIGMDGYHHGKVTEMETNITLGTHYMKMVLDDLDGSPVLASAAYNAGPKRPRAWRACLAQAVEGAIFVESIPFNETRDYVKKVMSNAIYYAALEGKPQSLKAHLGIVAPTGVGTTELP